MRKPLGLLGALFALAAATWAATELRQAQRQRHRAEADARAQGQLELARSALLAAQRADEPRAVTAAQLPQLQRTLATLRAEDDPGPVIATLHDGFHAEPWWQPFRDGFTLSGLSLRQDTLDIVVSATPMDIAVEALVRATRKTGLQSAIVTGVANKTLPLALLATAERLPIAGRAQPAVLVLARRLDEAGLARHVPREGDALAVRVRGQAVAMAGAAPAMAFLRNQPPAATPHPDAPYAWARAPLGEDAELVLASDIVALQLAAASGWQPTLALALGGAVAIGLLLLAFRSPRRPRAEPVPTGTQLGLGDGTAAPASPAAFASTQAGPIGQADTQLFAGAAPTPSGLGRVGRYDLIDRLGEGGMAQVFTAVSHGAEGFARRFVIKRLRPELGDNKEAVSQFIDEAKLGSTLVHSNIVPVFDFGKVGDEYFMAMEYILGRDLGRMVERSLATVAAPLDAPTLLFAAAETLKALDYAHTRIGDDGRPLAIVHRDVSPSNILISARGEVKLFDFGIVKAEGRVTRTEQGVVKGNVSFMSPEQARGLATDARSDLFSLGLVLYYCATGQTLYQGSTTYELLVKAATGPDDADRARIAALPAPLPDLVGKALAIDPAARWPSANAFAAAVQTHAMASSRALAERMQALFKDDLEREAARFSALRAGTAAEAPATRKTQP